VVAGSGGCASGFRVLAEQWPKVQKFASGHNQPGRFVSFLAYEWHSSQFGDYCLYYPNDGGELRYFDHVRSLQKYARAADSLVIPHHLAYRQGWRGANLEYLDPPVSPVVEIYSEHGLAEIDRVEVFRNGRAIHRHFPADLASEAIRWPGEFLCRIEFGWGPWGALNMARTCDWDVTVALRGGKLHSVTPCFQSGPFEEERRNRVTSSGEDSRHIQLYTSRRQAFAERATNAIVLHGEGGRDTRIEVSLKLPSKQSVSRSLGELTESNAIEFTGPFTSESFVIHRLVTPDLFRAHFRISDRGARGRANWYLVRVTQANGHQAWSSPIWVDG
jgi:hypothetical protein